MDSIDQKSYRMVRKEYYCYVCQLKGKQMISVEELETKGLTCNNCGQGFIEILDNQTDQQLVNQVSGVGQLGQQSQLELLQGTSMIDHLQNQRDERDDQDHRPPKVTVGKIEDLRQPNLQGNQRQSQNVQSNQNLRNEIPSQQRQGQRVRVVNNPFVGQGHFMNDFFGQDSPFYNELQQSLDQPQFFESNNRRQNQQAIFNNYFRPFSFTSMFDDDPFVQMQSGFGEQFSPHEFGINYNQNFRSSMPNRPASSQQNRTQSIPNNLGFFNNIRGNSFGHEGGIFFGGPNQGEQLNFDDFIQLIQSQMAQQQENHRPTNAQVLQKLPVVEIQEKHCKRKENTDELEMPTCSVCISEFEMRQKAMFLPCGHTFHVDCIKPWLKDHNTCPVCRKELPSQ